MLAAYDELKGGYSFIAVMAMLGAWPSGSGPLSMACKPIVAPGQQLPATKPCSLLAESASL